jgi:hypothetical protein
VSDVRIPRDQIIRYLRDAGWRYRDATVRVELYGKPGTSDRIVVAKRDVFTETQVRGIFSQAKFSSAEAEEFLRHAVSK